MNSGKRNDKTLARRGADSVAHGLILLASISLIVYAARNITSLAIIIITCQNLKAAAGPVVKAAPHALLLSAGLFAFSQCYSRMKTAGGLWLRTIILLADCAIVFIYLFKGYSQETNKYRDYGNDVYFPRPNWFEGSVEFKYDENGNRSCPYSNAKSKNEIILVGDSFVYGALLNEADTLCARLGDSLKKKTGKTWRIKNLAYPGLGLYSSIRAAENFLKIEKPDWIIVGYTGGAFRHCDSFCATRLMKKSPPVIALAVLLGANNTSKAIQLASSRFFNNEKRSLSYQELKKLDYLSENSSVLFFSYSNIYDDYLTWLKTSRGGKLDFTHYNIPYKYPFLSPLTIPYDGHPSAKANAVIADIIADRIISRAAQTQSGK